MKKGFSESEWSEPVLKEKQESIVYPKEGKKDSLFIGTTFSRKPSYRLLRLGFNLQLAGAFSYQHTVYLS